MHESREYDRGSFPGTVLAKAVKLIGRLGGPKIFSVDAGSRVVGYDKLEEFLAAYEQAPTSESAQLMVGSADWESRLNVYRSELGTKVEVDGSKELVAAIFELFDAAAPEQPVIFIGHGRRGDWKDLRDHLRDLHQAEVIYYEDSPHAGYSSPDIVEELVGRCNFGLLVFTGEDKQEGGTIRARQNVVHELGLVTMRAGRKRSIILCEHGVEDPSNISGVSKILFEPGRIESTYGNVLAVLRREFPGT